MIINNFNINLFNVGQLENDVIENFNDKQDILDFIKMKYYASENFCEDSNIFLYMKENAPLKNNHFFMYFKEILVFYKMKILN